MLGPARHAGRPEGSPFPGAGSGEPAGRVLTPRAGARTPRSLMIWKRSAVCLLAVHVLAACGGGHDVFPEAESLEKAGKLEEAAARFELVCPLDPGGPRCGAADARA